MIAGGVDPGNSVTGYAVLAGEAGSMVAPSVVDVGQARGPTAKDIAEEVDRNLERCCAPTCFLEVPPFRTRGDVRHGSQSEIGWKLGYLSGRIASRVEARGVTVRLVEVADWRAFMPALAMRWAGVEGIVRPDRKVRTVPHIVRTEAGGLALAWDGCDHRVSTTIEDVGSGRAPQRCPTCSGRPAGKRAPTGADARTERWKIEACRYAAAVWPEAYRTIVGDARSRARGDLERPDHEFEGVSDQCESLWVCAYAFRGDS